MADNDESNKRRRTAAPPPDLCIADLPDIILVDVASYLTTPSCALFAVAMTAPSISWYKNRHREVNQLSSDTTKVIISSIGPDKKEVLDFEDIEKSLAKKLTDDDVSAVLICIDAANNLKTLKLAGCVNITGHGLEPLRGSLSLKQIDLRFTKKYEIPELKPAPMISDVAILPILESIVDADGNSLRHLQLPQKWRGSDYPSHVLEIFLSKYNSMMINHGFRCTKCDRPVQGNFIYECTRLHEYTCYNCLSHFCGCREGDKQLQFCLLCKKDYCSDCLDVSRCAVCDERVCSGCAKECEQCEEKFCQKCGPPDACACWSKAMCRNCAPATYQCGNDDCNNACCGNCVGGKDFTLELCSVCKGNFCSKCRNGKWGKNLDHDCQGCLKLSATTIIAELQEESEREKEQLRQEIRNLRQEVKDLRGKLQLR